MSDQSDQPRRRRREAAAPAQGSVVKGIILVAVAMIVGFVLIRDDGVQLQTADIGADTSDEGGDGGDGEGGDDPASSESTDTSTPSTRPAGEVKVLVANGTDVAGAAGSTTDQLAQVGYVTGDAVNAQNKASIDSSAVYFTDGYEADARAVAETLSIPAESVAALPTTGVVDNLQRSNIVVIVGPEIANAG